MVQERKWPEIMKRLVDSSGLSKAEIARRMWISPQGLDSILKTENVGIETLEKLLAVLGYCVMCCRADIC